MEVGAWTSSRIFTATQDSVCLVAWDHLALMEAGDLLVQWEEWGHMAGVDMEVYSAPHMAWVGSQELMAWVMALPMVLLMASQTMALGPTASLKVMASSHLLLVNSLPILKVLQLDLNRRPRGSVCLLC